VVFLSRWFTTSAARERPTTSIYFAECMRKEIGAAGDIRFRIWALSPNVFYVPDPSEPKMLVMRDWDPGARRWLADLPPPKLYYLLDDDIWAGSNDPSLPSGYRERLRRLSMGNAKWLLQKAVKVYASSQPLAERLGQGTILVQPSVVVPPADLKHHDEERLRLVFVGTRSHLADLRSIEGALASFLRANPDCLLDTFLGKFAPVSLRLPNAIHNPPQSWQAYRATLAERHFHVALAPALPTAFNSARSHNKILEIACFGAAPVYSSTVPFAAVVSKAQAGFLCDGEGWYALLTRLKNDRALVRRISAANCRLAQELGDPWKLREFWHRQLRLPEAPSG
jgi:hypothetical protein